MNFTRAVLADIKKVTKIIDKEELISHHSLDRYFQRDQLPVRADNKTLDIFSRYLNYRSFGHFQQKNKDKLGKQYDVSSRSKEFETPSIKLELPKRRTDWFSIIHLSLSLILVAYLVITYFLGGTFYTKTKYVIALIIILPLLVLSFVLHKRKSKFKRYYDAFPEIGKAFSYIHQINSPLPRNPDLAEDMEMLKYFCTYLALEYSKITNSICAVCIKFIKIEYIETLIRDHYSQSFRNEVEIKDRQNNIKHKLSENSHFRYIFDHEIGDKKLSSKYFLGKDLAIEPDYQNSRIKDVKLPPNKGIVNRFKRKRAWSKYLPYRTTLVVPIVPLNTVSLHNVRLEGYLCIDSNKPNVFSVRDAAIIRGVADGIYPSIIKFRDKHFPDLS